MAILSPTDVADLQAFVEDEVFADSYEVVRAVTSTPDSRGNPTTTLATVEAGMCTLRTSGLQPSERAMADQLRWSVAYAVDLPVGTGVTPSDRLTVNGDRRLEIGGLLRIGAYGVSVTAVCRETG